MTFRASLAVIWVSIVSLALMLCRPVTAMLLVLAWFHTHWSVALCLTILAARTEWLKWEQDNLGD
jgi:hypothetical protein